MVSDRDTARIRTALEQRLNALAAELDASRLNEAAAADGQSEVEDRKDQAARDERQGIGDAEFERDLAEWRDVRAALDRLANGRYGLCVDCGEPIPAERLNVQPAAGRCAACQAVAERRHA